jgi:hypothetical protein
MYRAYASRAIIINTTNTVKVPEITYMYFKTILTFLTQTASSSHNAP